MRWKKVQPNFGDTRYRLRFALIPTHIGVIEVWLERYWAVQTFRDYWSGSKWSLLRKELYEDGNF